MLRAGILDGQETMRWTVQGGSEQTGTHCPTTSITACIAGPVGTTLR
ncbi:MAG: hypothetical protein V7646_1529 [Pseudonocardia sp.]